MSETIVCIGTVVRQGEKILLARQSQGHPLEGQWTIPWGRLDGGESPMAAAVRETFEEAGIVAEVDGLLGLQELPSPWSGWLGLIFLCRHISGTPEPQDTEMDAAGYFSQSDLAGFSEPIEPLSAWLARRIFTGEFTVVRMDPSNPLQSRGSFL